MNNKQQFQDLAGKLTALGESKDEFDFWLKIFDDLPEDKQHQLVALMLDELGQLQQIK